MGGGAAGGTRWRQPMGRRALAFVGDRRPERHRKVTLRAELFREDAELGTGRWQLAKTLLRHLFHRRRVEPRSSRASSAREHAPTYYWLFSANRRRIGDVRLFGGCRVLSETQRRTGDHPRGLSALCERCRRDPLVDRR